MIKINCQKKLSQNFTLDSNLEIPKGKFVCLYGKSGSGKTTLLRMIAGFLKADSGYIKNSDKVFFDGRNFLPPQKRDIGFLFQDYALFDNMNVIKNLLFAKKDKDLAYHLLELVELKDFAKSRVNLLSGGQKQRVALARALMRKPEILLLDEPLSALDSAIRTKLQDYLLKVHDEFKMTTILVSHDASEIYKLANLVYEMRDGKIVNVGSPDEVLLKTRGSQKFSFLARILSLDKKDGVFIAVIGIGNQISQIVLSPKEAKDLNVDDEVIVSAKAFALDLTKAKFEGKKDELINRENSELKESLESDLEILTNPLQVDNKATIKASLND